MITVTLILVSLLSFSAFSEDTKVRRIEKREETIVEKQIERDVTVTKQKSNRIVIMLFDYSGSMATNNQLENNKITVRDLVDQNRNNPNWQAGMIPFAGCYSSDAALMGLAVKAGRGNGPAIWNAVKDLQPTGATDYVRALRVGLQMLKEDDYADLLLFTDYEDTCGGQVGKLIEQLKQREITIQERQKFAVREKHVRIHVLNDSAGEKNLALRSLAKATGGKYLDSEIKQMKFLQDLAENADKTEVHILKENETETETVGSRTQEEEQQTRETKKQPERATQKAKATSKKEKRN